MKLTNIYLISFLVLLNACNFLANWMSVLASGSWKNLFGTPPLSALPKLRFLEEILYDNTKTINNIVNRGDRVDLIGIDLCTVNELTVAISVIIYFGNKTEAWSVMTHRIGWMWILIYRMFGRRTEKNHQLNIVCNYWPLAGPTKNQGKTTFKNYYAKNFAKILYETC